MAKSTRGNFNCPHCNTAYQVVKAEVGAIDRWVTCRTCRGPLPAREGKFILKYFFLRQAGRTDPRARRGSQQAKPTRTDSPGD